MQYEHSLRVRWSSTFLTSDVFKKGPFTAKVKERTWATISYEKILRY